jgi:hypothetical protein
MQPNRSPYTLFITLVLLVIMAATLLTGCAPSSTPTPTQQPTPVATPLPVHCNPINVSTGAGQTILTLPDGSQIYLAENTEIDITPAGYCGGNEQHAIMLKQGQVAINSLLPAGKMVIITSPNGYIGQVSETGLVTFDPSASLFTLACTNGTCTLAAKADKLTSLNCGESAFLDTYGNFNGPFNVDPETLVHFGEWLQPKCPPERTSTPKPATATPIPTETPTLDMGATATAYCGSFNHQFPLTPCPTVKP